MSVLRVGFNSYLLAHTTLRGWARYTVNLLAALPAHGVRPILYSNAPIHPKHLARLPRGSFEVRIAPPMRYMSWENRWVPRQLRTDNIDVFHCPMNYGMPWFTPCPRILTLHDAIDQIYYARRASWRDRWRFNSVRTRIVNWVARYRAHQVITVSEHAKSDLVHFLGVPERRVTVVYEAADPRFHESVDPRAIVELRVTHDLQKPYFLYLGGWEGRKNLPFLLRAFAAAKLPDVELVLAGGSDAKRAEFAVLAGELGCEARVRLLGFVEEDELPALYSGAIAFVYPSEYEGFGLQVCEAMAVGCPVLVARATSLPEIAGSGGETFGLDDTDELTGLLHRIATDEGARAKLAMLAKARSEFFSWHTAARETAAIYRRVTQREMG